MNIVLYILLHILVSSTLKFVNALEKIPQTRIKVALDRLPALNALTRVLHKYAEQ